MNPNTLFHQVISPWCFVDENRSVHIKLKTGLDVESVDLIYGDPHNFKKNGSQYTWSYTKETMRMSQDHQARFFNLHIEAPNHRLKYLFILKSDQMYYFGPNRITLELEEDIWNYFFLPYVHPSKTYQAPKWVKDTVWYQIFPDRFHTHDTSNPWSDIKVTNQKHYGGSLKGIIEKLPYLSELGITGVYLTPIFKALSSHKYDTIDYYAIDPQFGTQQDLVDLVTRAHQLNIKVMLDAVFNHTGVDFETFKLAQDKNSPYHAWYLFNETGYETFSMVKAMPKLNTEHPDVIDYFCRIATHWIEVADIDGWRLDVANEVSDVFWRTFRQRVKAVKPDVYILGELWHDGMPWLNGDMFDGVMNYSFTDSLSRFFLTQTLSLDQYKHEYLRYLNRYPSPLLPYQFNLLDSHDTDRMMTRSSLDINRVKQALAMMFFSVGTPCIYYGTEIGLQGENDPDNRRLMQFNPDPKVHELFEFIQTWIELKALMPSFESIEDYRFESHDQLLILHHQNFKLIMNLTHQDIEINPSHTIHYPKYYNGTLKAQAILLCEV